MNVVNYTTLNVTVLASALESDYAGDFVLLPPAPATGVPKLITVETPFPGTKHTEIAVQFTYIQGDGVDPQSCDIIGDKGDCPRYLVL